MKRHIIRHLAANDKVPGVEGNLPRHLDIPKAREQAERFRTAFAAENPTVSLMGHSPALRTDYTLTFCTIGICNGAEVVEIAELFPTPEEMKVIGAAYKDHGTDVSKYPEEAIAVCDGFGKKAAEAIRLVESKKGIPFGGETVWVGHAPTAQFVALHLAGNKPQDRETVLGMSHGEGGRFVIGEDTGPDNETTSVLAYVPLGD